MAVTKSFWELINCAWAPAKDDSDWAKSAKVIIPLSSLFWSVSTCLSNKSKFSLFILNFLFAKITPVNASAALNITSCSFFNNLAFAKFTPILLFSRSAFPPKPWKTFCSIVTVCVSVSTSVIEAFVPSRSVSFLVVASLSVSYTHLTLPTIYSV